MTTAVTPLVMTCACNVATHAEDEDVKCVVMGTVAPTGLVVVVFVNTLSVVRLDDAIDAAILEEVAVAIMDRSI